MTNHSIDETARHVPRRIVSGGQTGVDRGALDAALAVGVAHGGWCPRGRRAEDGIIPDQYQLVETPSAEYTERTEQNVIEADGTLILYRDRLRGGTELTRRLAGRHGRPCLLVNFDDPIPLNEARLWIVGEGIEVLNVAGPRESSAPGISDQAQTWLADLLGQPFDPDD